MAEEAEEPEAPKAEIPGAEEPEGEPEPEASSAETIISQRPSELAGEPEDVPVISDREALEEPPPASGSAEETLAVDREEVDSEPEPREEPAEAAPEAPTIEVSEAEEESVARGPEEGEGEREVGEVEHVEELEQRPKAIADPLQEARAALEAGDYSKASQKYAELVKEEQHLTEIIEDLKLALAEDPGQPHLWRTLGDAYMKTNRLAEAVEAYQRGVEAV
jgi:tetratricopeptide (TPR) repeat protein